MPLDSSNFLSGDTLLTRDEIITVVRAASSVGFKKVRLTGGEPLLRADVIDIVAGIRAVDGIDEIAMTTNAALLPKMAHQLVAAGLDRVNIHVDSLRQSELERVMRFASIDDVWNGIASAEAAGLSPMKLNSVVVRGLNDESVDELAALTLDRDWHMRFIELMPLGNGPCAQLSRDEFVPTRDTKRRIEARFGRLEEIPSTNPSDESRNYRLPAGSGVVGFISPVSEPYCGTCNRMRLTADGKFHLCLLNDDSIDVKAMIRSGGSVDDVAHILRQAVSLKPTGHTLDAGTSTEHRHMYQIGG